jgi:cytochrome c peroxidase
MGKVKDYFASRGGEITDADLGRFAVTKNEGDRHFFKVPTLRNVAVTHPYFHDGTKKDLEQAVKAMGEFQLSAALSEKDVELVTAFLGSLTGEYHGQSLDKMAPPSAPVEEPKP